MKNSIGLKILFAIIFYTLQEFICFGQKIIFELDPGLKFAGYSFQENKGNLSDLNSSGYAFQEVNRISCFQNINYTNKFGLEPHINFSFIQLNNKWKLGFGLSSYILKSQINLSSKGYSDLPFLDSTTIFTEYISKQLITKYQQYYFFAIYDLGKNNYLSHNLAFGFGVNKPSIFNPKNEKEFYQSNLQNQLGYIKSTTINKSDFWGYYLPFAKIKYELSVHSKKHAVESFTFFVLYIQGIISPYKFELSGQTFDEKTIDVSSINRGSGIRIGISKKLIFQKNDTNSVQL
jgi:hypothetical protein